MKEVQLEKLQNLNAGVMSMGAYCDYWGSMATEAISYGEDGETRSDLLYIAMYRMAEGKCENIFVNY